MINKIKFGEALKLLASALDISISRLSKAINVDTSLVNRWVNDNRIPSYNTTYIESISEYLSRNIHNSHQIQCIIDIISKYINVENDQLSDENIQELIRMFLREAQGYSFEIKKQDKISKTSSRIAQTLNSKRSENSSLISLSNEDKIIPGFKNIIKQSITLLENAANSKNHPENNVIYITYYTEMYNNHNFENDGEDWIHALYKAIESGWSVTFLIRLDDNIRRITDFIHYLKPLFRTGGININYIKNYECTTLGSEKIVIPGIGAMSIYSIGNNADSYYAFYFTNADAVEIIKLSITSILASASESLTNYYGSDKRRYFSVHLMEIEESIGARFLYRSCFSIMTLPENIFIKLLNKAGLSEDERAFELKNYKIRHQNFLNNLKTNEYKDIYWFESIEKLIRERKFYLHSKADIYIVDMETQDIIEHLQYIKMLLEQYENYEISFVHRAFNQDEKDYYIYVKERKAAFIGYFDLFKSDPGIRMIITEPTSVKALINYLRNIWEHISPVNKDKQEIIEWINKHILLLKAGSS